MFIFILIINGYLTWRPIVIYGEAFYLGIRVFTIPVEDFLFGFSLITLNLIIWECFDKKMSV
jgi:lycopene cyclase domain-containing protein